MAEENKQLESAHAFAEVYNDVENFPSLADVAGELGIAVKTVKNRAGIYRNERKSDKSFPELIYRGLMQRHDIPMSEQAEKHRDWDEQQVIDELRRIAEEHPEQVISRNFFRVHSSISESTWNQYFGTFEEYKRAAGIKLSRQAHNLERQIAKHASVDHYRKMSVERMDYADKYEKPSGSRFKTVMVANDIHDEEVDPFWLRVFLDTAKRVQPDVIVLNGDIFDLPEFGKYGVDPREWDVVGRIQFAHDNILRPLREACPESQIDFIEGNHEARLLRLLADATPALRAVLADLHGWDVSKLLGLDEFEINYIAKADLAAWAKRDNDKELGNNYKVYWDTLLFHHFPHARNMGLPGANGHHHSHQVWPMFSPIFGAYEWHQFGCGHKRSASYTEGEKWHMGFGIINVDTDKQLTNFDYIPVTDIAISGGKWYHREEFEFYLP